MTFLPECGADKRTFLIGQRKSIEQDFSLLKWVHNDFMYARFAGMRNTKTWSKSTALHVGLEPTEVRAYD